MSSIMDCPFRMILFLFPLLVVARPPAFAEFAATVEVKITTSTTTTTVKWPFTAPTLFSGHTATSSLAILTSSVSNNAIFEPVMTENLAPAASSIVDEAFKAVTTEALESPALAASSFVDEALKAVTTEALKSPASAASSFLDEAFKAITTEALESPTLAASAEIEIASVTISPSELVLALDPSSTAIAVFNSAFKNEAADKLADAFTGDITYYEVGNGLGSCGEHFEESDMVVALSPAMMANAENPNKNPKCFTYITLYHPDSNESSQGKVVSTCPGCNDHDVDLSPALFNKVAPAGDGRVEGVSWHWS